MLAALRWSKRHGVPESLVKNLNGLVALLREVAK